MTISTKANTIEMTLDELAALPRYSAQPGGGYFRGESVANGHPMVATWVNDPLDGWKRLWYHVDLRPSRAFNSCANCGENFYGPRGASDYIEHDCSLA